MHAYMDVSMRHGARPPCGGAHARCACAGYALGARAGCGCGGCGGCGCGGGSGSIGSVAASLHRLPRLRLRRWRRQGRCERRGRVCARDASRIQQSVIACVLRGRAGRECAGGVRAPAMERGGWRGTGAHRGAFAPHEGGVRAPERPRQRACQGPTARDALRVRRRGGEKRSPHRRRELLER
jgi:hypothetical protein